MRRSVVLAGPPGCAVEAQPGMARGRAARGRAHGFGELTLVGDAGNAFDARRLADAMPGCA
jgi:hypothetical protein